ncbi:MAG: dephospho-CoA kinase [Cyclobacteriaceae bacterium]
MSKPKLIGITGGIGSGKSTVCEIFEVLGVKVYYADNQAKELMVNDPEVVERITSIFGDSAYVDGGLNRTYISQEAFKDKVLLERLNDVIHPAVKEDFEGWVATHSSEKLLLKEAALLIETKSYQALDGLVLVIASEQTRIERVLARDSHRNEEGIRKIMSEQLTDDVKMALADFVIDNEGGKSLIQQTMSIYKQLVVA